AVKLKRRPPFTTLATRLIVTTRSMYAVLSAPWLRLSRPRRSPPWRSPARCPRWAPLMRTSSTLSCSSSRSEGQAALTGAVGQGRDATVVLVAGTVEDDRLDTGLLGARSHELADALGLLGLVRGQGPQVRLHGGGGGEGLADLVVHDLHADVARRPGDDEARTLRGAVDLLATAHLAA